MALPEGFYDFVGSYDDRKHATNPARIQHRSVYHRMLDIWGESHARVSLMR